MSFLDVSFFHPRTSLWIPGLLSQPYRQPPNRYSQHIRPSRDAPRRGAAPGPSLHFPSLQCPGYARQLGSPESLLLSLCCQDPRGYQRTTACGLKRSFNVLGTRLSKSKCGRVVLPPDLFGESSLPLPVSGGLRGPQAYSCMALTSAWVSMWLSLPRCPFFAVFQKAIDIGLRSTKKEVRN